MARGEVEEDGERNCLYHCMHEFKDIKDNPTGKYCAHPAILQTSTTNISLLITHSKTHRKKVKVKEDDNTKKAKLAKGQKTLSSMFPIKRAKKVSEKKRKDPPVEA